MTLLQQAQQKDHPLEEGAMSDRVAETIIDIESLFAPARERGNVAPIVDGSGFQRRRLSLPTGLATVLDYFAGSMSSCCFMRHEAAGRRQVRIGIAGGYGLEASPCGGWLLVHENGDKPFFWLPRLPAARIVTAAGHILDEVNAALSGLRAGVSELAVDIAIPADSCLDWLVWQFPTSRQDILNELREMSSLETRPVFLWGSHTLYERPSDLYAHLIHGSVYENRYAWPHMRKICSENDAHALYVTFAGLERATGKRLYGLFKDQLLLSVMDRQGEGGGWRHGEWSGEMESHYRLHCSAMHLLMDALDERDDPVVRRSLENAAAFISSRSDTIDAGVWFLHDSLEHSMDSFKLGPFSSVSSQAFGKSAANMLVLNTHLDTSIALARYGELTGDRQYAGKVESACNSTRAILAARPAEWLYRFLFRMIGLTFLPTRKAERLPVHLRAVKRLAWKYLIPRLPEIKARFPRLVMPGGYIDRELTMRTWAIDYQSINLMDLARYYRRRPSGELFLLISDSLRFTKDSGLAERWKELKGREYALAFLAEALYHACLTSTDQQYRAWLAETMIDLENMKLGLPPSLLGANAEAVKGCEQVPCLSPADARLRVANLSRGKALEFLCVNPTSEALLLAWEWDNRLELSWSDNDGAVWKNAAGIEVPARGWVWGKAGNGCRGEGACVSVL